jgi:hypothetical protein
VNAPLAASRECSERWARIAERDRRIGLRFRRCADGIVRSVHVDAVVHKLAPGPAHLGGYTAVPGREWAPSPANDFWSVPS